MVALATPAALAAPFSFMCGAGFTPSPAVQLTTCVCMGGNTVCNDMWVNFPTCRSQGAKHEVNWRDATCANHKNACGIWGSGRMSYECGDISKDYAKMPHSCPCSITSVGSTDYLCMVSETRENIASHISFTSSCLSRSGELRTRGRVQTIDMQHLRLSTVMSSCQGCPLDPCSPQPPR